MVPPFQKILLFSHRTSFADIAFALGTGSGAMGRHTKRGGYLVDWNKVRTYVVPDMTDFNVSMGFSLKIHRHLGAILLTDFTCSSHPMSRERPPLHTDKALLPPRAFSNQTRPPLLKMKVSPNIMKSNSNLVFL
jgi:Mitochondrial ribosomal protein L27